MNRLKVVAIVSSDPSDIYFANLLARHLNVVAIIVESQVEQPSLFSSIRKLAGYAILPWRLPGLIRDRAIVRSHVKRTSAIDRAGFGVDGYELAPPPACLVVRAHGKNAVNRPEIAEQVRRFAPDLLVLCGCSIIREPLLSIPALGALNLHGGLAQRYRGVWTTLWAMVNEEPEYVGATVHFVNSGIDDGDIVYQGRPEIAAEDDPESLYVKVVKLGVAMMVSAVEDIETGRVQRYPLEQKGHLYLSRMVTSEVLHAAWSVTEGGVIPRYLAEKSVRDTVVLANMRGIYSVREPEDLIKNTMARRGFIKTLAATTLALHGIRFMHGPPPVCAAVPRAKSRVVTVLDNRASRAGGGLDNVDLDAAVVREMVNGGILAFTGESDLRRAWLKIIPDPSRKVAIKVNCQIRGVYTKAKIVQPLLEGLLAIGVNPNNIIIYDMTDTAFDLAGFIRNTGAGIKVGTVADFGGYSRVLYHRLANLLTGGHDNSGRNLLSQVTGGQGGRWDCAYLINVPVLKALDGYSGVTLSMKNHYGSIGNPSEHHEDIMEYIPEINALPEIRNKTRLVVLDAIFGEYKWVNGRNQQYVARVNKVLVSDDPVAIDATGWQMIEDLRARHGIGPVQPQPAFIARAASMGLGNMVPEWIEHLSVDMRAA